MRPSMVSDNINVSNKNSYGGVRPPSISPSCPDWNGGKREASHQVAETYTRRTESCYCAPSRNVESVRMVQQGCKTCATNMHNTTLIQKLEASLTNDSLDPRINGESILNLLNLSRSGGALTEEETKFGFCKTCWGYGESSIIANGKQEQQATCQNCDGTGFSASFRCLTAGRIGYKEIPAIRRQVGAIQKSKNSQYRKEYRKDKKMIALLQLVVEETRSALNSIVKEETRNMRINRGLGDEQYITPLTLSEIPTKALSNVSIPEEEHGLLPAIANSAITEYIEFLAGMKIQDAKAHLVSALDEFIRENHMEDIEFFYPEIFVSRARSEKAKTKITIPEYVVGIRETVALGDDEWVSVNSGNTFPVWDTPVEKDVLEDELEDERVPAHA